MKNSFCFVSVRNNSPISCFQIINCSDIVDASCDKFSMNILNFFLVHKFPFSIFVVSNELFFRN